MGGGKVWGGGAGVGGGCIIPMTSFTILSCSSNPSGCGCGCGVADAGCAVPVAPLTSKLSMRVSCCSRAVILAVTLASIRLCLERFGLVGDTSELSLSED